MVPAPFNLIPTAFFAIHRFHLINAHFKLAQLKVGTIPGNQYVCSQIWARYLCGTFWARLCCFLSLQAISSATVIPQDKERSSAGTEDAISKGCGKVSDDLDTETAFKYYPDLLETEKSAHVSKMSSNLENMALSISVCGTVTDIAVGLLMAWVAPFIEMAITIASIYRRSFDVYGAVKDILLAVLVFIMVYIPFIISLSLEAIHQRTTVRLVLDELNPNKCRRIQVQYADETRYDRLLRGDYANQPQEALSVKVIKTIDLAGITGFPPRNPILKVRLGHLEAVLTESIQLEDGSNMWTDKKLLFPIKMSKLTSDKDYKLTIKVVDYDSSRNEEVILGEFSNQNRDVREVDGREQDTWGYFSIPECIANKKFEGKLKLDDSEACIQVDIEAKVQRTLETLGYSNKVDLKMTSLKSSRTFTMANNCEHDEAFDVSVHDIAGHTANCLPGFDL
jgi:hypothetical protein